MRTNIYASFKTPMTAQSAVGALLDHGARVEDVSLVLPGTYDNKTGTTEDTMNRAESGITTTTGADAASGAAKGAGIGLGVGAVAALVSVLVPGIGLVIGGGALATALAGAAATTAAGAIAGGMTGYLKDQGVPEEMAGRFSSHIERGGAVVSISVPSNDVDYDRAQAIFAKYGENEVEVWNAEPIATTDPHWSKA
jgi:hypothetical protein